MISRNNFLGLLALLVTILILTGAVIGQVPRAPLLGELAPFLILAAMTWYLIILIVERENIIDALAALLKVQGKKEQPPRGSFWLALVTYASIFGLAIVALWFRLPQQILARLEKGIQAIRIEPGGGNVSNVFQSNPLGGFLPITSVVDYGIVLSVSIFIVSFIIILLGLKRSFVTREEASDASEVELKLQAAQVVQHTISGLQTTKEYHETIVQCYRNMCKILADAGMKIAPTETAREFAENISIKLRVGEEAVRGLTFLFEEARYSSHLIREQNRVEALSSLESLRRAFSVSVGMD